MNLTLGATYLEESRCQFIVWAPLANAVDAWIFEDIDSTSSTGVVSRCDPSKGRLMRLKKTDRGYHEGTAEGLQPGTRYLYCLDQIAEPHRTLLEFYQELITLRKTLPALTRLSKEHLEVRLFEKERALQICRWTESDEALIVANFSDEPQTVLMAAPVGNWCMRMDTAECRWGGPGSTVPHDFMSIGEVRLSLCPKSFSAFQRMG